MECGKEDCDILSLTHVYLFILNYPLQYVKRRRNIIV